MTITIINEIFFLLTTYFIGSVNFSIIILKLLRKHDPRYYGSNNPGATNVYRQTGARLAIIILLLDACRAASIGIAAKILMHDQHISFACLGLILGNGFPCFHNFKGGKGVSNYLGFTSAISPLSAFAGILTWILVFSTTRIPFLASLSMILVLSAGTITLANQCSWFSVITTSTITALIIGYHHNNISQFQKNRFK